VFGSSVAICNLAYHGLVELLMFPHATKDNETGSCEVCCDHRTSPVPEALKSFNIPSHISDAHESGDKFPLICSPCPENPLP
jgi:hypothetical protein